jgi:TatD DNase family protein
MLIDSHAHIQGKEYAGEVETVIARAREAGIDKIIAVGGAGEMSSNHDAVALASLYDDVGPEELKSLRELTIHPKVIAVGETGLDYYYSHSPHDVQRRVFMDFINLARQAGLPLIVHERDAAQDAAQLLRSEGTGDLRGVIHCFTGNYEAACAYLDLGFYLSFTGIITFKNAEPLRDVVRQVPLKKILIETDSPYLTPVPHRGKRNEPAYVRLVAEAVAIIKSVSLEEVAQITSGNARELFSI